MSDLSPYSIPKSFRALVFPMAGHGTESRFQCFVIHSNKNNERRRDNPSKKFAPSADQSLFDLFYEAPEESFPRSKGHSLWIDASPKLECFECYAFRAILGSAPDLGSRLI